MKFTLIPREYFWFGIIAMLIILFFIEKCKHLPPPCPVIKEVKIDTQYLKKHDTIPEYIPEFVKVPGATIHVKGDVVEIPVQIPQFVDTMAILHDYYSRMYYSDTQKISYGNIVIQDTLWKNRIVSRRLFTDFKIPEITKTVTLMEPLRNKLFFGLDAMIDKKLTTIAGGPSLMFLTKKDLAFDASAMYSTKNDLWFRAGMRFKISLHKKIPIINP